MIIRPLILGLRALRSYPLRILIAIVVAPILFRILGLGFPKLPDDILSGILAVSTVIILQFPADIFKKRVSVHRQISERWQGRKLAVKAKLVPRYFWTSASIDVYLDDLCVLKTGGQWKTRGKQTATFIHNTKTNLAELSWKPSRNLHFPYVLSFNGEVVADSEVYIRNWPLGVLSAWIVVCVPILIILAFVTRIG